MERRRVRLRKTLVVAVVSVAFAVVTLIIKGGPMRIISDFPADFVMDPDVNYSRLLVGMFVFASQSSLSTS